MERLYERIESGEFARIWLREHAAGCEEFRKLRENERRLLVETVGAKIRARSLAPRGARGRAKKGS
jgi:ketol-acid reductoisomerase